MGNVFLRQDENSGLMIPVVGASQGPGVYGQPVVVAPSGFIDPSLLPNNYDPCVPAVAEVDLAQGDLCYFAMVGSVRVLRKADARSKNTLATCFVKSSWSAGAMAAAYLQGVVSLPNPGNFTSGNLNNYLWLNTQVPGYFQTDAPYVTGEWAQHVLTITAVTAETITCFFAAPQDAGRQVGSETAYMGVDYILDQSADFLRALTLYEDDGVTRVNLTGAVGRYQARNGVDGSLLLDLDTATKGGLTFGGTSGVVTLSVSAARSAALSLSGLPSGVGVEALANGSVRSATACRVGHSLLVTLASGVVVKAFDGNLFIVKSVVL